MKNGASAIEIGYHFLQQAGTPLLIEQWRSLNEAQQTLLAAQLATIDRAALNEQKELLKRSESTLRTITPFTNHSTSGNTSDAETGKRAIAQGLVGCLIVAGGQGTRLGFDGPKGMYPVTLIKHKSLFELLAEKVLWAGKQAGRQLSIAIMTSEENDLATLKFFKDHHYFGLDKEQVSFFRQNNLPLLDENGHLFLEDPTRIAEGPDGNGGALQAFHDSGIYDTWLKKGVKFLNFILIDNPLADPFDAEMIGFQMRTGSEVTVKCTQKASPDEKVGILAIENGSPTVVEYSELSSEEANRCDENGRLTFNLANMSLFSFSMDFLSRITKQQLMMPLHKAFKAAKYLDEQGKTVKSAKPIAWKFERFIFDILPHAKKVNALVYPREQCFAPLKNSTGQDSPSTVTAALETNDRRILREITGSKCDASPLEISQAFYYPTRDLINKWKEKLISDPGYIEP